MTLSSDNWLMIRCIIFGIVFGTLIAGTVLWLTGTLEIFLDGLISMAGSITLVLNTSIKY